MARTTAPRRGRQRGQIEVLPSGSLRVTVYAGTDPLTRRRHFLREVIPAGPTAAADAQKAMRRLGVQVDEQRNPRTKATVEKLLDEHFALLEIEPSTLATYRTLAAKHIIPLIGNATAGPSWSTGRRGTTRATPGVGRTPAVACPSQRSGRSTSSSAVP